MKNYLYSPDCSFSSTVKVFRIMIDELKECMEDSEYECLRDNVIQLREKDIRNGKFNRDHFIKLMHCYLKIKSDESDTRTVYGMGPLTESEIQYNLI